MTIKPISQRIRETVARIVELEKQLVNRDDINPIFTIDLESDLQRARQELDYLLTVVKTCLD